MNHLSSIAPAPITHAEAAAAGYPPVNTRLVAIDLDAALGLADEPAPARVTAPDQPPIYRGWRLHSSQWT